MKYKVGDKLIAIKTVIDERYHLPNLIAGKEYVVKSISCLDCFVIESEGYSNHRFDNKRARKYFIRKEDFDNMLKYNNIPTVSTPLQNPEPTTLTTTPGSATWVDNNESTKYDTPTESGETNPEPEDPKRQLTPLSKFYKYIKQTQQYIPPDVQIQYQKLLEEEEKVIKFAFFFGRDETTKHFIEDEDYYFDFKFQQLFQ